MRHKLLSQIITIKIEIQSDHAEKPFTDHMWPAKGFSAWPHFVFWELKVKRSGHAEKPFTGHSYRVSHIET